MTNPSHFVEDASTGVAITFATTTDCQFSHRIEVALFDFIIRLVSVRVDIVRQTVQFSLNTLFLLSSIWMLTWSGLSREKTTLISVAVTQSWRTGELSKFWADGLFSRNGNATRFPPGPMIWDAVQTASCSFDFVIITSGSFPKIRRHSEE